VSELLVLQHHAETGPSAFVEVLDGRRSTVPWRLVDLGGGEPVPSSLEGVAGLLVMGGPMSVTCPEDHAWFGPERQLLRDAVAAEVPVLGVCLGAQLLGVSLGGEVAARRTPRATYAPLRRTAAGTGDAVTAGWPDGAPALLLHEDEVVRYPEGATPLLTDGDGGVVAWGVGSALAIQAHPEVDLAQLERWTQLDSLTGLFEASGIDETTLLEEAQRRERFTVPLGRAFLGRWLDGPIRDAVS
jgi:GMP synthase (glutamine-hydrolysing)